MLADYTIGLVLQRGRDRQDLACNCSARHVVPAITVMGSPRQCGSSPRAEGSRVRALTGHRRSSEPDDGRHPPSIEQLRTAHAPSVPVVLLADDCRPEVGRSASRTASELGAQGEGRRDLLSARRHLRLRSASNALRAATVPRTGARPVVDEDSEIVVASSQPSRRVPSARSHSRRARGADESPPRPPVAYVPESPASSHT